MEQQKQTEQYAMYLRKSRADIEVESLTKEDTLRRHKAILTDLAHKRHYKIAACYEEVVSGESISDRPEMQRLLSDIYQHKYKGVLVVEVERLARGDTKDQGTVADAFKYTDTLIITPTKTYDPNNEFDEEYFEFGLFMSRREYKTISRRMQRGKLSSVKEGNYLASKRPYGYDIIRPSRKIRTLTERPDEARYIRLIYDWFVNEKLSAGAIARRLTSLCVPTYNGKQEWSLGTVNEILHNPLYKGYVRWSYRQITKTFDSDGNLIESRPRHKEDDAMILAKGRHEGLVSAELWEAAQLRFAEEPTRVKLTTTMKNPFAGLVWCKRCGRSLFYHDTKKSAGTRIRMAHRPSQICHQKSCFYDDFVAAVIQILQDNIADFECKLSNQSENDHLRRHQELIDAIQKEITDLNLRRAHLFDLLERRLYSEEDFIERKALLDAQLAKATAKQDELIATAPQPIDYAEKICKLSEAVTLLQAGTTPAEPLNKLLKSCIRRIEYARDTTDPSFTLDIYIF